MQEKFEKGDFVTWRSAANGTWRTKTGKIVSVIEKDGPVYTPEGVLFANVWKYVPGLFPRYLVEVLRFGKDGRPLKSEYFMPIPSKLELVI
jgi:hypothetical protein